MAHMHYVGTGKVHSYRGLLAEGDQRKIRVQGATGDRAWRITKLEIMHNFPGTGDTESTVQVWREKQDSISTTTATVDFGNDELLAAAYIHEGATTDKANTNMMVIFDNALFVRNIYVSHTETSGTFKCNYYIELEEVKVGKAGMAQLAVAAARRAIS
jgi:hypothetical protein